MRIFVRAIRHRRLLRRHCLSLVYIAVRRRRRRLTPFSHAAQETKIVCEQRGARGFIDPPREKKRGGELVFHGAYASTSCVGETEPRRRRRRQRRPVVAAGAHDDDATRESSAALSYLEKLALWCVATVYCLLSYHFVLSYLLHPVSHISSRLSLRISSLARSIWQFPRNSRSKKSPSRALARFPLEGTARIIREPARNSRRTGRRLFRNADLGRAAAAARR